MAATEEELVASVLPKESNLKITKYSDIKAKPIEWYDKYWLPVEGLAGLAGPPDTGKSTLFAYEIAQLTTGAYEKKPVSVIYLTKEDDTSMVKSRLVAAGADLERVYVAKVDVPDDNITYQRDLDLTHDLEELSELLTSDPEIKAIYLDPATSFLGIDEDKSGYSELRRRLEILAEFSRSHGLLIRLMKHTKKDQATTGKLPVTSLVFGSQAWTEVARIFSILWPVNDDLRDKLELDDEDETNRLLLRGKNNYAPNSLPSKAFKIDVKDLELDEKTFHEVPYMSFIGNSQVSGDDVAAKRNETSKETETRQKSEDKTDKWIREQLANGPIAQKVLQARAQDSRDISWMTVRRRQSKYHISVIPGSNHNEKQWSLNPNLTIVPGVDDPDTPDGWLQDSL